MTMPLTCSVRVGLVQCHSSPRMRAFYRVNMPILKVQKRFTIYAAAGKEVSALSNTVTFLDAIYYYSVACYDYMLDINSFCLLLLRMVAF